MHHSEPQRPIPRAAELPGTVALHSRPVTIPQDRLRNFSIIAHIDHGKSTLADRLLELTHTIDARQMTSQVLDSMDLEREKGITIKARAVRLEYTAQRRPDLRPQPHRHARPRRLHLRGQPQPPGLRGRDPRRRRRAGHRGPDARQRPPRAARGPRRSSRSSTRSTCPSAQPDVVIEELENVLAIPREEVILASAKDGTGVAEILEAIVDAHPAAQGRPGRRRSRASIFDSHYDAYKGVVAYVRLAAGHAPATTSRSG